jgi:hypothetical protein
LFAALCGGSAIGDSIIYGIGSGSSPYELYQISATTGAGIDLGPIDGFGGVTAMAAAPNGTLFASRLTFLGDEELLTLNPTTGTATLATPLTGVSTSPANPIPTANAYAFSPGGTLFAIYGDQSLLTIDTSTGQATLVGSLADNCCAPALAFSNGGMLYLSDGTDLYTVNQSTGATSLVAPLDFDSGFGLSGAPNVMSMSFDPTDGTLYTSVVSRVGNGSSSFGTINVTTGEVAWIGSTVMGLGALAIEATAPETALSFVNFCRIIGHTRLEAAGFALPVQR